MIPNTKKYNKIEKLEDIIKTLHNILNEGSVRMKF